VLLTERTASRLGAMIIVVAIAGLIALLPERYHIVPDWFGYLAIAAMIAPMLLGTITKDSPRWRRI
jgi:hypothetical protein